MITIDKTLLLSKLFFHFTVIEKCINEKLVSHFEM